MLSNGNEKCFITVTIYIISVREQTNHYWHNLNFLINNQYEAYMEQIMCNSLDVLDDLRVFR